MWASCCARRRAYLLLLLADEGFFDGIDPSMEYAAMIDGCTRWGAFVRVAVPSALRRSRRLRCCAGCSLERIPVRADPDRQRVPMITVVMAQFVTEMGLRWNLMAATAVMALVRRRFDRAVRAEICDQGLRIRA